MIRRMFGMVVFSLFCFVCNDSCAMDDEVVVSINSECSSSINSKCNSYGLVEVFTYDNQQFQESNSIDKAYMIWKCEYSLPRRIIASGLSGVACCDQITQDIDCSNYSSDDGLAEVFTYDNQQFQESNSIDKNFMIWKCEYSLPRRIIASGLSGVACCDQITQDIDCSNYSSDDIPQCVKTEKKDCKQSYYPRLSLKEIKRHQKRIKSDHRKPQKLNRKPQKLNKFCKKKYCKNINRFIKNPQHKSFKNSKKIR